MLESVKNVMAQRSILIQLTIRKLASKSDFINEFNIVTALSLWDIDNC